MNIRSPPNRLCSEIDELPWTIRSISTLAVPWTGSGRGRFGNLTQILRRRRRVSALLNGLNVLDVTPFPVSRQLYPAANKSPLTSSFASWLAFSFSHSITVLPLFLPLFLSPFLPLFLYAFVLARHECPSTCHC